MVSHLAQVQVLKERQAPSLTTGHARTIGKPPRAGAGGFSDTCVMHIRGVFSAHVTDSVQLGSNSFACASSTRGSAGEPPCVGQGRPQRSRLGYLGCPRCASLGSFVCCACCPGSGSFVNMEGARSRASPLLFDDLLGKVSSIPPEVPGQGLHSGLQARAQPTSAATV